MPLRRRPMLEIPLPQSLACAFSRYHFARLCPENKTLGRSFVCRTPGVCCLALSVPLPCVNDFTPRRRPSKFFLFGLLVPPDPGTARLCRPMNCWTMAKWRAALTVDRRRVSSASAGKSCSTSCEGEGQGRWVGGQASVVFCACAVDWGVFVLWVGIRQRRHVCGVGFALPSCSGMSAFWVVPPLRYDWVNAVRVIGGGGAMGT